MGAKSFTHLDLFDTCPLWYKNRYVLKVQEPETPELKEGNKLHKAMEMRVGKGHMLPPEYADHERIALSLSNARQGKVLRTELKLGVTRVWQPCDFFADDVMLRGAIDVLIKGAQGAAQFDYKTGKPSTKTLQLEITNMLALIKFPELQTITGMNIYMKSHEFKPTVTTTRADLPHLTHNIGMMVSEIEEAEATDQFPAKPSGLCGWCPVKTCKHNRNPR